MEKTIITHDTETAMARLRFVHNDVTVEDNYSLIDIVPTTRHTFGEFGEPFTEHFQLLAMDRLEAIIQNGIESGMIQNPPEAPVPEYEAPPEQVPEEEGDEEPAE